MSNNHSDTPVHVKLFLCSSVHDMSPSTPPVYGTMQLLYSVVSNIAQITSHTIPNSFDQFQSTSIPHHPYPHNSNQPPPFCAFSHCPFCPLLYLILQFSYQLSLSTSPHIYHHNSPIIASCISLSLLIHSFYTLNTILLFSVPLLYFQSHLPANCSRSIKK